MTSTGTTGTFTGLDTGLLQRGGITATADGPVATVTLDRPATKNAQTPATWRALAAVGESLGGEVRVVVIAGAGDSFSSGLDRRMLGDDGVDGEPPLTRLLGLSDDEVADTVGGSQVGFSGLRGAEIISGAAVQGHAIGAGFQLALACDLRVVADDAVFSMREPMLGLVPDLTGTKPLVDLVGYARALEICATSRWVTAEEARQIGLATAVVPRDELTATVADLAAALTAAPSGAVTETKALLQSAAALGLDEQRRREREAQVRRFRDLAARAGD